MIPRLAFGLILFFPVNSALCQIDKDTVVEYKNIIVEFLTTDSTTFPDYFTNQRTIDSISRNYDNFHLLALAIEKNQLDLFRPNIDTNGSSRIVILDNGEETMLSPNELHDEAAYTFEKLFRDKSLLLFRVQWFEGNNYFLLNTKSGEKTYTIGRVYFSLNGKYCISINDDIEASYSANGFQLFSIGENNSLEEIWEYSPNWGPENIKWIDDNTLIAKGYYFHGENWEKKTIFKKILINVR
jgi:hypothetical protein